jgi:hypothetical protein
MQTWLKKLRFGLFILGIFTAIWLPVKILADVPTADTLQMAGVDDDLYPESRFGSPPAAPDLGAGPKDRIGDRLETTDRKPASLPDTSMITKELDSGKLSIPTTALPTLEIALIAGESEFFPKKLFVTQDRPVRVYITGASKKTLCLMLDEFQIKKQVRAQKVEEVDFVPRKAGAFRFYCPINGIEGTLFVKDKTTIEAER